MLDKNTVIEQILKILGQEISVVTQAAKAAHEAAIGEESKAEDQYDTRGLEASYLAGAQSARVAELEKQSQMYQQLSLRNFSPEEPIAPGALIELSQNGSRSYYFVVGLGGGFSLQMDGKALYVISTRAPLGEALLGRRRGEVVEVEMQNMVKEYQVLDVI